MKKVRYTTRHGLKMGLGGITSDISWFLEEIEISDRTEYMEIFKNKKMSKRKYVLVYQDERYSEIVITDAYGKKTFLEIKEY